jgi:hypothetical protein
MNRKRGPQHKIVFEMIDALEREPTTTVAYDGYLASIQMFYTYYLSVKREAAEESFHIFDSEDPLYGWGIYAYHCPTIKMDRKPDGLTLTKEERRITPASLTSRILPDISATRAMYIIHCLAAPTEIPGLTIDQAKAAAGDVQSRAYTPEVREKVGKIQFRLCNGGVIGEYTEKTFRIIRPDKPNLIKNI